MERSSNPSFFPFPFLLFFFSFLKKMRFYSEVVFPLIMDWAMSRPFISECRREILAGVEGEVLEIGFGTGLNLPHYPEGIKRLAVVDPNAGMNKRATRRISESGKMVAAFALKAERLPMPEGSFDSVVSTWTLCSVEDPQKVLAEVYRVLKPGGRFFYLEHGASRDPRVKTWQDRLTPVQKVLADGCHLNRDIKSLVEKQGFQLQDSKEFYLEKLPKVGGYMYRGVAVKV